MARDTCGATRGGLVCDRAPHVIGDHRGYLEAVDEVLFWRDPGGLYFVDDADRRRAIAAVREGLDVRGFDSDRLSDVDIVRALEAIAAAVVAMGGGFSAVALLIDILPTLEGGRRA